MEKESSSSACAPLAVPGYGAGPSDDGAETKYNTKVGGNSGRVEGWKSGGVEDAGRGSYVELKLLGIDEERRKKFLASS